MTSIDVWDRVVKKMHPMVGSALSGLDQFNQMEQPGLLVGHISIQCAAQREEEAYTYIADRLADLMGHVVIKGFMSDDGCGRAFQTDLLSTSFNGSGPIKTIGVVCWLFVPDSQFRKACDLGYFQDQIGGIPRLPEREKFCSCGGPQTGGWHSHWCDAL